MARALRATVEVTPPGVGAPEEASARCQLVNDGDEPVVVNLAPLSSPSLALAITDGQGEPVLLPPPPVPPAEPAVATLAPGAAHSVEFRGFLPSWTPPGRYQVRFRYVPGRGNGRWSEETLVSDPADLRIG